MNTSVVVAKPFRYKLYPSCLKIGTITMWCKFICLINIMSPVIFVYKPFSQNKSFPRLSLYCSSDVILLLFIRLGAARSNFTRVNCHCRVCWYRLELAALREFFEPLGLVHHIDYVPLQTRYINNVIANIYIYIQSFNW